MTANHAPGSSVPDLDQAVVPVLHALGHGIVAVDQGQDEMPGQARGVDRAAVGALFHDVSSLGAAPAAAGVASFPWVPDPGAGGTQPEAPRGAGR